MRNLGQRTMLGSTHRRNSAPDPYVTLSGTKLAMPLIGASGVVPRPERALSSRGLRPSVIEEFFPDDLHFIPYCEGHVGQRSRELATC